MRVAVMQSSYMPWKGYFDLIHEADLFIFYDDVQFTKNDWRNRNQIKTPNGPLWLSVPVGQDISRRICDVEIKDHKWQEKHFKTLRQYYRKAEYWRAYVYWLEDIYLRKKWTSLLDLNQTTWRDIAVAHLGIDCKWDDSRRYKLEGQKEARLLNLLQQVGCTEYISTPAARNYIKEEDFQEAGIKLRFTDISGFPEYPQLYPPFTHRVSVLDLLLNTGPEAPYYIWGWRR